jgi:hypothetical protein
MGATNTIDRVSASFGLLNGVATEFKTALDVPNGGVLLALPALLAVGLLKYTDAHFKVPAGYYQIDSLFLLLAFMALARMKSVEQLRYYPPGEWGKVLGLDRVPEVKTLRKKLKLLAKEGKPQMWSADLCKDWMAAAPDDASALYVDGHVRVYHGSQAHLPRHYVSRQKLCLRATADYWVNAMDGQPFFVVTKDVDPGLIDVLEKDIVPRLLKDVPSQPTERQLQQNRLAHRFTVIFDREGYSPALMRRLKDKRIACITYHKHPEGNWPEEEFSVQKVKIASGEQIELRLAERGTFLEGGPVWLREVRKLAPSGAQTAVLATEYTSDLSWVVARMSARWSQENFFRYMRQHYGLDRLLTYDVESIPDTTKVVNPAWRDLDGQIRRCTGLLNRKQAEFGATTMRAPIEPAVVDDYERRKATLQQEIEALRQQRDDLKNKRKNVSRHIPLSELPPEAKYNRLAVDSKHFIDTIKMVAYRAETAMAHTLREKLSREVDTRALLVSIYKAHVDLVPDEQNGTLTVRLHHLANHCEDEAARHLCAELTDTATVFPGTKLRLVYELVSPQNPGGQDL